MRRVFPIALLVLLVVGIVLAGLMARWKPVAPWFSAVSNGNGYDALVQAAGLMKRRISEEKGDEAAFVKENEGMFERVDSALKLPFEVPSIKYSVASSMMADFSSFKTIALALRTRGKDAEHRGMNGEAVTNYTNIIRLGQQVEHGPIIALLVGIALEKIGLDALEKLAVGLTPAQRKEVADKIELLDRERLPFSEIILREEHYAHQVAGNPLKLLVARFYIRSSLIRAEQKQQKLSADFQRAVKELRSNGE